jgi:hypothetical protein
MPIAMSQIYFKEKQRFNQIWIWILNVVMLGFFIFIVVMQAVFHKPVGKEEPEWVLYIVMIIPLLMMILFYSIKLETEVRREGIHYRFYPFIRSMRMIRWDEISRCYVRRYNPIREYGGWGYRTGGRKYGIAYNISGNQGLQIEFKNGKKLLLGTNKPRELEEALKRAAHHFTPV